MSLRHAFAGMFLKCRRSLLLSCGALRTSWLTVAIGDWFSRFKYCIKRPQYEA